MATIQIQMGDNAQRSSELTTKFPVEPKSLKASNFGTAQMHLFIQKEDLDLIKVENEAQDTANNEILEQERVQLTHSIISPNSAFSHNEGAPPTTSQMKQNEQFLANQAEKLTKTKKGCLSTSLS